MGLDAVIVSDPALIEICATYAPGLNIHLSTQASATNVETFHFWKEYGLTRVVLAREVSMEELAEIRKRTDLEIEAFVHGAMCISYSGRCTLSNHMSDRDANRGGLFSILSLEIRSLRYAIWPRTQEYQRASPRRILYVSRGHVYDRKYSRHD